MKYNIKKRKGIKFAQGQIANVHDVHVWVSVCTVSWFVLHICVHTKCDSLCTLKCACVYLCVCLQIMVCVHLGFVHVCDVCVCCMCVLYVSVFA